MTINNNKENQKPKNLSSTTNPLVKLANERGGAEEITRQWISLAKLNLRQLDIGIISIIPPAHYTWSAHYGSIVDEPQLN
jgi:hypothetical protein